MTTSAALLLAAFLLDCLVGDPPYRLHPVRLIGKLVVGVSSWLRRAGLWSRAGGTLLAVLVPATVLFAYGALRFMLLLFHPVSAVVFDLYIAYSCLALRDLVKHAIPVADALNRDDLAGARTAVQKMIGRVADSLDGNGVARAAVESVSEGSLDGFLSPLFWFLVGAVAGHLAGCPAGACGVGAMLVYRCVNTMDSMVGYRSSEYLAFGSVSARSDDLMNFLPARLTGPILYIAAALSRLDANAGWRAFVSDRLKHASPNSAHPESFMAGALGIVLGGPSQYPHGLVVKPWIGNGSSDVTADHIQAACRLVRNAGWLSTVLTVLFMIGLGWRH